MKHSARQIMEHTQATNSAFRSNWYTFTNVDDADTATLYVYDDIGLFGLTAGDFADELKAVTAANLEVRISSKGGDIFDGVAIFNALRSHKAYVTTVVDGAALSIASVVAQAGDTRHVMSGSQMMLHNAHGISMGDAADMEDFAEVLRFQTDIIAGIYAEMAGGSGSKKHFRALMEAETWLSASDAVDEGLADSVIKPEKAATIEADNLVADDRAGKRAAFAASMTTEITT